MPTFKSHCLFSCYCILGVLYGFCLQVLCQIWDLEIFSPNLWLMFSSLTSVFHRAKVLHFDEVQFIMTFLLQFTLLVTFLRTLCTNSLSQRSTFSSKIFILLHLDLFWVNFLYKM